MNMHLEKDNKRLEKTILEMCEQRNKGKNNAM